MKQRKNKKVERIKNNRSLKEEIIEKELLVEFSDVFFWWI